MLEQTTYLAIAKVHGKEIGRGLLVVDGSEIHGSIGPIAISSKLSVESPMNFGESVHVGALDPTVQTIWGVDPRFRLKLVNPRKNGTTLEVTARADAPHQPEMNITMKPFSVWLV
ncbi:MAG: hypothetical protein JJT95_16585 [Pararhodobacter sp.]|nr:hypothetical protein [Pararhodobacter sp.]